MAEPRFDEQQVGAILKRATEIQSDLSPETTSTGMTLPELQRIASEVGIEAHVVEQAARELQSAKPAATGSANSRTYDCTVEGIVTDDAWDDIVTRLREFVGRPGTSTVQGNTREWAGGWDIGHVTLTATTRGDKTRFRMWIDTTGGSILSWIVGPTFGGLATLMTCAVLSKHSSAFLIWLLAILGLLTTGLGTFFAARGWRRKLLHQAETTFASVISQGTVQPQTQAAPAEAEVQRITVES